MEKSQQPANEKRKRPTTYGANEPEPDAKKQKIPIAFDHPHLCSAFEAVRLSGLYNMITEAKSAHTAVVALCVHLGDKETAVALKMDTAAYVHMCFNMHPNAAHALHRLPFSLHYVRTIMCTKDHATWSHLFWKNTGKNLDACFPGEWYRFYVPHVIKQCKKRGRDYLLADTQEKKKFGFGEDIQFRLGAQMLAEDWPTLQKV